MDTNGEQILAENKQLRDELDKIKQNIKPNNLRSYSPSKTDPKQGLEMQKLKKENEKLKEYVLKDIGCLIMISVKIFFYLKQKYDEDWLVRESKQNITSRSKQTQKRWRFINIYKQQLLNQTSNIKKFKYIFLFGYTNTMLYYTNLI